MLMIYWAHADAGMSPSEAAIKSIQSVVAFEVAQSFVHQVVAVVAPKVFKVTKKMARLHQLPYAQGERVVYLRALTRKGSLRAPRGYRRHDGRAQRKLKHRVAPRRKV